MQPIVTVGKQFRGIPTLSSDVGVALPIHCRIERRIVWNLLAHLRANGYLPRNVWDGEERIKIEPSSPQVEAKDAMEVIFSVDESVLRVARPGGKRYSIALVCGNGIDIISDWSFTEDEEGNPDAFDKVMDAFDAHAFA